MRYGPAHLVVMAFAGALAGCRADPVAGPHPEAPSLTILGDLPTHSILAVDGVELRASEGFLLLMGINRGLVAAGQAQPDPFQLEVTLEVTGKNGRATVAGKTPVTDLKTFLAEPRPDPLLGFSYSLPWDGQGADGAALEGPFLVVYRGSVISPKDGAAVGPPVVGQLTVSPS